MRRNWCSGCANLPLEISPHPIQYTALDPFKEAGMHRWWLIGIVALCVVLNGCGDDDTGAGTASNTSATSNGTGDGTGGDTSGATNPYACGDGHHLTRMITRATNEGTT